MSALENFYTEYEISKLTVVKPELEKEESRVIEHDPHNIINIMMNVLLTKGSSQIVQVREI